jgi:hypothetical protein
VERFVASLDGEAHERSFIIAEFRHSKGLEDSCVKASLSSSPGPESSVLRLLGSRAIDSSSEVLSSKPFLPMLRGGHGRPRDGGPWLPRNRVVQPPGRRLGEREFDEIRDGDDPPGGLFR